jgi:phosphoribosylglycinamide formyltransferase-1
VLRLAIIASHEGTTAQAVIDATAAGRLAATVVVVVSNNSNASVLERARLAGIDTLHLSGVTHPDPLQLDTAMMEALDASGADVVVLAGYMKRLGAKTLDAYRGRVLNTHPALLPKFGGQGMFGLHVHEAVLAAGDSVTGATVHLVDEEYDRGRIIAQREVPVFPDDEAATLSARVLLVEHALLIDALAAAASGDLPLGAPYASTMQDRGRALKAPGSRP